MSRHPVLAASALVVACAIFLTWPQALNLRTKVANHNDPYFSMWRLGWIAHAVRVDPQHLYDANIYYPDRRTLAYSDAMILEGAIAAPLLWAGLSPVLVYNLMLTSGIALSGLGMFVLARYLTRSTGAALFSAVFFTLMPYRVEHFMHLELQWTMWMPLAFWAAHLAVDRQSWRFGALCGVFVWLQVLSCVYYGVFLAMMIVLLGVLLIVSDRQPAAGSLGVLAVGAAVAVGLSVPYALPYIENSRTLGPRDVDEVTNYSAHLLSYVTAPYQNWIWGWTADHFRGDELHLAPGIVTVVLAVIAVGARRSRHMWIYVALCAVSVELSLGLNGHLYAWLHANVTALQSLRAIARFSILAFCALAVLAGFGVQYLQEQCVTRRAREWVAATAIILLTLECGSLPMYLETVPSSVPPIYRVLTRLPPGVVAEFPMAEPGWLPGFDPIYEYWSLSHWNPLINGYSGYASARYVRTLKQMMTFPDRNSIARLRELHVRYILIHQALYDNISQWTAVEIELIARPDLMSFGRYKDWIGDTALFELR